MGEKSNEDVETANELTDLEKEGKSEISAEDMELLKTFVFDPAEVVVKACGMPELATSIEKLYFEKLQFEIKLAGTEKFAEFWEEIQTQAKDVEEEVSQFHSELELQSEMKKAQEHQRHFADKERALKAIESTRAKRAALPKNRTRDAFRDFLGTTEEFLGSLMEINELTLQAAVGAFDSQVSALTSRTRERLSSYKLSKIIRRIIRELLRFFTAVICLGLVFGSIVSETLKYIFASSFVFVLLGLLAWTVLKEYVIGPWYRKHRLAAERRDLGKLAQIILDTRLQLLVGKTLSTKSDEEIRLIGESVFPINLTVAARP